MKLKTLCMIITKWMILFRLLSNYVTWQMIREKVGLMSKSFRKARSDFNNNITGVKDSEDRWRTCTSITNDNMGVPIGSLYIRKYFDDSRVNTVIKESCLFFLFYLFINKLKYRHVTQYCSEIPIWMCSSFYVLKALPHDAIFHATCNAILLHIMRC
jgi:hypothetical protein